MLELFNPRVAFESLQAFIGSGGPVLFAIMILTFFLWGFILERGLYWTMAARHRSPRAPNAPGPRARTRTPGMRTPTSERLLSEVRQEAGRFNDIIKVLVNVTPLLGLLGTVTGMVFVFDVMAVTGSSNARLMAEGISRATLPTMAGLMVFRVRRSVHLLVRPLRAEGVNQPF